jgi:hypothetical protein
MSQNDVERVEGEPRYSLSQTMEGRFWSSSKAGTDP